MVDSVELKELTFQLSNSLDRGLNEFRYAAQNDNKNIRSIIKDIANMFSTQRRDISGINNAIEESMHVSEDQAERVSETNSLLNDSIALQGQIISELKNVAFNIRSLAENMGILLGNQGYLGITLNAIKMGAVAAGLLSLPGDTDGGGGNVPATKATGSLATNQQEAYKAAKSEGLSDKAAKILVANMSGESLRNPSDVHPDPSKSNPNQKAHGIVQWDDSRALRIKNQFGKWPQEMSVSEQTKAAIWEMKTDPKYSKSWADLNNENLSDRERMSSVVTNYERPGNPEKAIGERMGFLGGLNVDKAGATPEGSTPSNDIVALGKYLQGQGLRVSEHPAFGGVDIVHSPNSAHYSNRAIDVNIGDKNVEANDPAMGKRFDELAQQLRKSGYKVIWRQPGHYDHMHVQVGGGTSSIYEASEQELKNTSKPNQTEVTTPQSAPTPAYNEPPKINEKKRTAETKEIMPMQKISSLNIPATPSSAPTPIQNNNTSTINNSYIKSAEIQEHHEKAKFQQAMLETSNKNVENIQQAFHDTSKQGTPLPWEYNNDHDKNLGPSWPEMVSWSYPEISKKIRLSAFT